MGGGVNFPEDYDSFAACHIRPAIGSDRTSSSQIAGDSVFGSVPSRSEVEKAILDLQRFMHSLSESKSEFNGVKGLLHNHDSEMQQAPGFVKFRDAFSMMQSEPAFRNLVSSISCDKAVWDAMLSNKAIQDIRQEAVLSSKATQNLRFSTPTDERQNLLGYGEQPDIAILIMRWIADFTKSKILDLIERFLLLVDDILGAALRGKVKPATLDLEDHMQDKVRSSFLLSVVIVMIIVATRSQGLG